MRCDRKRLPLFLVLVLSMGVMSGCLAIAVGAAAVVGTATYKNGALHGTLEGSPEQIATAARKAYKELGFAHVTMEADDLRGEVRGKSVGTSVTTNIKRVDDDMSNLTIRVGFWGNQEQSQRIFNMTKTQLGQ